MNESGADAATAAEDDGNERASERNIYPGQRKRMRRSRGTSEFENSSFTKASVCYFTYFPLIGCLLVKGVRISYEPIEISDYAGRQEKLSCLYKLRAERKPRSKE